MNKIKLSSKSKSILKGTKFKAFFFGLSSLVFCLSLLTGISKAIVLDPYYGAPLNLAAVKGDSQVALTWEAPSQLEFGAEVSDYIVQYKKAYVDTWTTFDDGISTNANVVVTSLQNGVKYNFRVAAKNPGDIIGNYSEAKNATPNSRSWKDVGTPGFSNGQSWDNSIVISPDGTPYVAYHDDGLGGKAVVKKFDGTSWVTVGAEGLSEGSVGWANIAFDGNTPYVAYVDSANDWKATVMKFDGTNWVAVGSAGFTPGAAGDTRLFIRDGIPYVAFWDTTVEFNQLTVMKYDDGSWQTVGSPGISEWCIDHISPAVNDGKLYVAFWDCGLEFKATLLKYNDQANVWSRVGDPISDTNATNVSLAFVGNTPYVAYDDYAQGGRAVVEKFDGTNWVTVGNSPITECGYGNNSLAVSQSGTLYLANAGVDGCNDEKLTVYSYVDDAWQVVDTPGISEGGANEVHMTIKNETPYVAFWDNGYGAKTRVLKYGLSEGQNTTDLTSPEDSKVQLTIPENAASVGCTETTTEGQNGAGLDSEYNYPLGLVNFCFENEDVNNTVSLTYVTDLLPSEVLARKYDPNTQTYANIDGAVITETTLDGQHALKLTYTIADNGPLDKDPTVGHIEDPVGLAYVPPVEEDNGGGSGSQSGGSQTSSSSSSSSRTTVSSPNTGLQHKSMTLSAIALLAGTTVLATLVTRAARSKKQ